MEVHAYPRKMDHYVMCIIHFFMGKTPSSKKILLLFLII